MDTLQGSQLIKVLQQIASDMEKIRIALERLALKTS
jgi:hypothetical protein